MALRLVLVLSLAVAGILVVLKNVRTPDSIGLQDGRLRPLPTSPNAVSSQTDDKGRLVAPLPFRGNLEQTRAALMAALRAYPGRVKIETETRTYLHCVFSTDTLRFRDDVEFLLDERNRLIHFRSASRIGYSDLGANRRRYEILAELYRREG
jgi:uncharacterized protein (DUF1499 family)